MSVVIKAENISKQYKLGTVGMSSLADDVQRFMARVRGKEDPFLKIGEENNREKNAAGSSGFVWALRDISFEIGQGEIVGVIGKNGAGKSTLLKILSRVTEPTHGRLKYKGRLASLLEVGTGFHPDLSGRDNIFLNGAILGMKKDEILRKFDEIVDFSGVARYIDTPVKRYSSGMYVRLAFAVAAHLDPDILIVDEVLAVGDADFQKKCLGKIKDVSSGGRTVLFVSHNIQAIKALCGRGLLLRNGQLVSNGPIEQVIADYLRSDDTAIDTLSIPASEGAINTGQAHIRSVRISTLTKNNDEIFLNEPIKLEIAFECHEAIEDGIVDVRVVSKEGVTIAYAMPKYDHEKTAVWEKGTYKASVEIENSLQPDSYFISIGVHYGKGVTIHYLERILQIRVLEIGPREGSDYPVNWVDGFYRPKTKWTIENTTSV